MEDGGEVEAEEGFWNWIGLSRGRSRRQGGYVCVGDKRRQTRREATHGGGTHACDRDEVREDEQAGMGEREPLGGKGPLGQMG